MNNSKKPVLRTSACGWRSRTPSTRTRCSRAPCSATGRSSAPTWTRSTRTSWTSPSGCRTTPPRPRSSSPRPAILNGFDATFKVAPAVLLHGAQRRGHHQPVRQGRDPGQDRADRVGPVALPGVLPGALPEPRLRHVHHRARGGVGHRRTSPTRSTTSAGTTPDFQKLFEESEITVDDKKRRELYVKMQ